MLSDKEMELRKKDLVFPATYASLIALCTRSRLFSESDRLFDEMLAVHSDLNPDSTIWQLKIDNLAMSGQPDQALDFLNRLRKNGLSALCEMYNSVLKAFVNQRRSEDVLRVWLAMKDAGVQLNNASFVLMLKNCAANAEAERAFFLLDEMRMLKLEPDITVFNALFLAVGKAPHWVNGYGDYIFDAMAAMEGKEIIPTVQTYNNIIFAFSNAG
jgi:pentatricopeptide repeat protein